jgi:hypothetical protein
MCRRCAPTRGAVYAAERLSMALAGICRYEANDAPLGFLEPLQPTVVGCLD